MGKHVNVEWGIPKIPISMTNNEIFTAAKNNKALSGEIFMVMVVNHHFKHMQIPSRPAQVHLIS
jgi:hypothetical protein